MKSTEILPEALQWSEGMLLSPQHFQQNDIHWHGQLQHLMAQLQPYYWGLLDLDLDESELSKGVVRIKRLHCVMPDGLVVQYPPREEAPPLMIDLSDKDVQAVQSRIRVQLMVPVRTEGAASSAGTIQRYESLPGRMEYDENTGEGRVAVHRLRPRLSLGVGRAPANYVAMPLLEVVRGIEGHYRLSNYHPPILSAAAAAFLGETSLQFRLTRLITALRTKANQLAGRTGEGDSSWVGSISESHQRQIRYLVSGLPAFEVLVRCGCAHPFDLYRALAHLLGEVAAISPSPVPPLLPVYDHDDTVNGFDLGIEYVRNIVDAIRLAYSTELFTMVADGNFSIDLQAGWPTDKIYVELRPRPGQTVNQLEEWISRARIGSGDIIGELKRQRLTGAGVHRFRDLARLDIREKPNCPMFEIENTPVAVEVAEGAETGERNAIRVDQTLYIQGADDDGAPAAIVLYVPSQLPGARS